MTCIRMPCHVYMFALLFTIAPVFCGIRQLKWMENLDRANLNFPDPVFVQNQSTLGQCLSMCSNNTNCDGVTFLASTTVCRGHGINDVLDIGNGVASPGTRIWTSASCRRIDYTYVDTLDWCIKTVPSILPISRGLAESTCSSENARLVWVDSEVKHTELVKRILPLLWFVSGSKVGGVWKLADGTPVVQNTTFWNPLPAVPFVSNCVLFYKPSLAMYLSWSQRLYLRRSIECIYNK